MLTIRPSELLRRASFASPCLLLLLLLVSAARFPPLLSPSCVATTASNAESSRPWKPLETPVQRYARLKSEVEQFAQDMTRAAEIAESEGKVDESLRSVPEAMQEEIRALHSRLNSVLAPDSDGTGGAGKGAIPGAGQESLVQRLQTEVGSFSSITGKNHPFLLSLSLFACLN